MADRFVWPRRSSWLSALPTGSQHTNFGGGLGEREAERNLPQRESLRHGVLCRP